MLQWWTGHPRAAPRRNCRRAGRLLFDDDELDLSLPFDLLLVGGAVQLAAADQSPLPLLRGAPLLLGAALAKLLARQRLLLLDEALRRQANVVHLDERPPVRVWAFEAVALAAVLPALPALLPAAEAALVFGGALAAALAATAGAVRHHREAALEQRKADAAREERESFDRGFDDLERTEKALKVVHLLMHNKPNESPELREKAHAVRFATSLYRGLATTLSPTSRPARRRRTSRRSPASCTSGARTRSATTTTTAARRRRRCRRRRPRAHRRSGRRSSPAPPPSPPCPATTRRPCGSTGRRRGRRRLSRARASSPPSTPSMSCRASTASTPPRCRCRPPPPTTPSTKNIRRRRRRALPRPPPPPLADERAGGRVRAALAARAAPALDFDSYRSRLAAAAARLRDPSYSPRDFHDDMRACFPELELYTVGGGGGTSSGRSSADEYKRTVGALMAVYWFCRLHLPHTSESEGLDGQRGFCFSRSDDATWRPPPEKEVEKMRDSLAKVEAAADSDGDGLPERAAELRKRLMFRDALQWGDVEALLIDARILRRASGIADGPLEVDVPRATAMLALTAIHDIMKVQSLLPSVLPADNGYCGYEAGTTIHDHDVAAGLRVGKGPDRAAVLRRVGRARAARDPLHAVEDGLQPRLARAGGGAARRALLVVQETHRRRGRRLGRHRSFYFVHWLTDLAGAVPTPLEGSTQFAVRFPQPVLALVPPDDPAGPTTGHQERDGALRGVPRRVVAERQAGAAAGGRRRHRARG